MPYSLGVFDFCHQEILFTNYFFTAINFLLALYCQFTPNFNAFALPRKEIKTPFIVLVFSPNTMGLIEKEKKEREKFNIRLGSHIREKRLAQNISAAELARLCFMDKPNLLRIEKGKVNTSIYVLNKIAEALNISLEELFRGF